MPLGPISGEVRTTRVWGCVRAIVVWIAQLGGTKVRKLLICAAALSGFAAQASAADLSDVVSAKDPLPDALTFHGVTVYGTVDVGYGYNTQGLPVSGANYNGLAYQLGKISDGSISSLTNNALEQSKIGVKIEEQVGLGFTAIAKLETNFNPISGEIGDNCASMVRAAGYAIAGKNGVDVFGDGSRCGQAFGGQAYGGVSNPLYGTLTFGRQYTLLNDGVGVYDPLAGSYAFSLLASGTPLAGIGTTATTRWDNSVKYIFQYGPAHVAGMYSSGGQDTPILGDAYGVDLGFAYKGFAIDGYYTRENGAVALSADSKNPGYVYTAGVLTGAPLDGTVTNNEAWSILGKYTFEFGGGFKDEGPSSKLTVFAGYNRSELSNPDHLQTYYNGDTTGGGYSFFTNAASPLFLSNRILETEWGGAAYEVGPWNFIGAYYHMSQNSYTQWNQTAGAYQNCAAGTAYVQAHATTVNGVAKTMKDSSGPQCAGDLNEGSFVIDYKFNKHFDVYAGVSIYDAGGGLGSGYLQTETVNFASGLRIKF